MQKQVQTKPRRVGAYGPLRTGRCGPDPSAASGFPQAQSHACQCNALMRRGGDPALSWSRLPTNRAELVVRLVRRPDVKKTIRDAAAGFVRQGVSVRGHRPGELLLARRACGSRSRRPASRVGCPLAQTAVELQVLRSGKQ